MTLTRQESIDIPSKIEELEGIRGLAALLVVFYHIPKWNPLLDLNIISNGYLMVPLFFVLSGFVIYNAYITKITTCKQLFHFQFLRLGRLYPIHILFLIIFLTYEFARYIGSTKLNYNLAGAPAFEKNNFTALIQNIFLLQGIGPTGNDLAFNGPSWSISVEFYAYIIFGLVTLVFNKSKQLIFLLLFLASTIMLVNHSTYGFENLLRCIAGFFLGCMCASLKSHVKIVLPSYLSLISLISIVVLLEFKKPNEFDFLIDLLAACLILSIVLSQNGIVKRVLKCKFNTWLGTISYTTYMSHMIVILLCDNFVRRVYKAPIIVINDIPTAQLSFIEVAIVSTVLLSAILVFSHLLSKYIEIPFRIKSRNVVFN